jgi:hypothetical protein
MIQCAFVVKLGDPVNRLTALHGPLADILAHSIEVYDLRADE